MSARKRDNRVLYFAYGSNLNLRQMNERCPGATPIAPAVLPGWTLSFRRVADIVQTRTPGACVQGAVYLCTPADVRALDMFEGVRMGAYQKEFIRVPAGGNASANCLVYLKTSGLIEPPYRSYLDRIRVGYSDWGLDPQYLDRAYKYAKKRADERQAEEDEALHAWLSESEARKSPREREKWHLRFSSYKPLPGAREPEPVLRQDWSLDELVGKIPTGDDYWYTLIEEKTT
jgi:hypothetical protein